MLTKLVSRYYYKVSNNRFVKSCELKHRVQKCLNPFTNEQSDTRLLGSASLYLHLFPLSILTDEIYNARLTFRVAHTDDYLWDGWDSVTRNLHTWIRRLIIRLNIIRRFSRDDDDVWKYYTIQIYLSRASFFIPKASRLDLIEPITELNRLLNI